MNIKNMLFLLMISVMLFNCGEKKLPLFKQPNDLKEGPQNKFACTMHPEIKSDLPGRCRLCGMKFLPDPSVSTTFGKYESEKIPEPVLEPTNSYILSRVKAIKPVKKSHVIDIVAFGSIVQDANQINTISSRVNGRIEKLYVKYLYQPILAGQKLMEVYSQEVVTEQRNLLLLLKDGLINASLAKASEKKLLLLGVTIREINEIKQTGKANYVTTIYSPYNGYLVENPFVGINSEDKDEGMQIHNMIPEISIKEGMYVSRGQTIFNINNSNKVWTLLKINPEDLPQIKTGQELELEIDGLENKKISGKIGFIEPVISDLQTFINIRIFLDNPEREIKIGSIVKANIPGLEQKGLFIPNTAIVNTGLRDIVFVQEHGIYKSRIIQTGQRYGEFTKVIKGIKPGTLIAENGQFLIDSESFISEKNE